MATKSVVVTRGSSFIGAHLIENLLRTRHHVCVIDNSENRTFLEKVIDRVEMVRIDMARNPSELIQIFKGYETVFHLADTYGGCNAGHYQPALLCDSMAVDNIVIDSAATAGVNHVQFCSSSCNHSWKNGWAQTQYGLPKLSGDSLLRARCEEFGMKGSIVKLPSTYGPGQSETHPVMALIAKAFVHQEPYEMPDDGMQHSFAYVQDIAECMTRAAERMDDCSQVNLGTKELVTISGLMEIVFKCVGWRPGKVFSKLPNHVDGGYADASNLEKLGFGEWKSLHQGVKETADWYMANHTRAYVQNNLQMLLQGMTPQQPSNQEYRKATKLRKLSG